MMNPKNTYIYILIHLIIQFTRGDDDQQWISTKHCFYQQYFNDSQQVCQQCPTKCDRCISTSCIGCQIGQKKDQNCLEVSERCEEGQTLNVSLKKCQKCDIPFCKSCQEQGKCDKCYSGFILQNGQECIKDESSNESDKFFNYACGSMQIDNKGDCISQEICSSYTFKQDISFSQNVNILLQQRELNYIIGISHSQAIVFNQEDITYAKELLNLPNTDQELIVYEVIFKNAIIILTDKNIFIFNLETFSLMQKYTFESDQIKGDLDFRQIYCLEREMKIIYLALTSNSRNIRKVDFDFTYDRYQMTISLSQQNAQNTNLLDVDTQYIQKYYYFPDYQIIAFITHQQVSFFDLQSKSIKSVNNQIQNKLPEKDLIMLQKNEIENNEQLIFYAFSQIAIQLKFLQITYDRKSSSLSYRPDKTIWNFFIEGLDKQYNYFNWFLNEIGTQIYVILIAHQQFDQNELQQTKFIGIAYIEDFIDQTYQLGFSLEYYGIFDWFKGPKVLLTESRDYNNLMLLIPYQNSIQLYEILKEEKQIHRMQQTIGFDQGDATAILIKSAEEGFKFFFILGKIVGKFTLFEDIMSMNLKMSSNILFNSKEELFFEVTDQQDIYISKNIQKTNEKYSFIITYSQSFSKFSIIQIETLENGKLIMIAQSFFSHTSNKGNENSFNILIVFQDDENEIVQINTQKGVYQIKYHSLQLYRYVPLQNVLTQDMDIIVYFNILSDNTYQMNAMIISRNLKQDTDQIINLIPNYESNDLLIFILVNEKERQFFYIKIEYQEGTKYLLCYYFGRVENLIATHFEQYPDLIIQYLSENEIGFIISSRLFINNQFFKVKFLIDDKDQMLIQTQIFDIPFIVRCLYLSNFIQISSCSLLNGTQISIIIFNWQSMNFVNKDDGNYLAVNIIEQGQEDYFDMVFSRIHYNSEIFHIYILLQQYLIGDVSSPAQPMIYICSCEVLFDPSMNTLVQIQQFYSIIQVNANFLNLNNENNLAQFFLIYSEKSRILYFEKFFQFSGYIDNSSAQIFKFYQFWKDQSSLMFFYKNKIMNARRYGGFLMDASIDMSRYICSIDQLSLVVILKEFDTLLFLTIDSLQIIYEIEIVAYSNILWSKKFNSLIIIDEHEMKVYYQQNQFNSPSYTVDMPQLNHQVNHTCHILDETAMIVCHNIGLFDYQLRKWYLNGNLLLVEQNRKTILSRDNKYYAIFYQITNLFIFSFETKQFLDNKSIPSKAQIYKLYLHKDIKNQLVFQSQDEGCSVYSLPNFNRIFYYSVKNDDYSFREEVCIYDDIAPQLIIGMPSKVLIYKLPYNSIQKAIVLPPFKVMIGSKYVITETYLYNIFPQRLIDLSRIIRVDAYNLQTGDSLTKEMILTEDLQSSFFIWEEKDIIYCENAIISLGNINFGWSSGNIFLGYDERFNYMFTQNEYTYQFQTLDVSEMFPFNDDTAQLTNQLDIKNTNIYIKGDEEIVMYFNYQLIRVIKSSFNNEQLINFLDLQKLNGWNFQLNDYPSGYKSPYQLFKVNNLSVDQGEQNIYGFVWKCKLLIFTQDNIMKYIDLVEYKCQIYIFDIHILILKNDGHLLQQIFYQNNQVQIKQKQILTTNSIDRIFSDLQNEWILVTHKMQNQHDPPCTLYKNTYNNQDLLFNNIEIPSSQITLVRFININQLKVLLIGQSDSTIIFFQLPTNLNPTSTSFEISNFFQQQIGIYQFQRYAINILSQNII